MSEVLLNGGDNLGYVWQCFKGQLVKKVIQNGGRGWGRGGVGIIQGPPTIYSIFEVIRKLARVE